MGWTETICTGLALFALGAGAVITDGIAQGNAEERASMLDLQGHRGARGLYPENSLAAFEAAVALGMTTLELDVGLTRDGVLVAHHDRRLNPERARGPGGEWLGPDRDPAIIAELTFEELQGYDIGRARPGSRTEQRYPDQKAVDGQRIPALTEVIALAEARSGSTVWYNIETKISPESPEESAAPVPFADALTKVLRDSGVAARSIIQSFDWRTLQRAQATAPEIATSYLTAERDWLDNLARGRPGVSPWSAGFDPDAHGGSVPQTVNAAGGKIWSPYFRDLRPGDLEEAQQLGLRVVVWTVNEPGDMAALIDAGVDGIISDYPDRLRAVAEERGYAFDPASRSYRIVP